MTTETNETEADEDRDLKREHYERIIDLQKQVRDAGVKADIDKEVASAAKKHHEALQKQLNQLIAGGPQGLLPLEAADTEPQKLEAWADTPIAMALEGITDKQLETLAEAGVATVGEFEQLRAGSNRDYPRGLVDLPRVGEKLITKWEDQVIEWLANYQPPEPEAEPASESEEPEYADA